MKLTLLLTFGAVAFAQTPCAQGTFKGTWNGWGATGANTRFQSATTITPANVSTLEVKWVFGFPGQRSAFGQPTVVDGPFAEAKELVAGFSVVTAGSLADVIEIINDWPQLDGHGNVQIEIRQIATAEDLHFSDDQRKRHERMLAQEAAQQQ